MLHWSFVIISKGKTSITRSQLRLSILQALLERVAFAIYRVCALTLPLQHHVVRVRHHVDGICILLGSSLSVSEVLRHFSCQDLVLSLNHRLEVLCLIVADVEEHVVEIANYRPS